MSIFPLSVYSTDALNGGKTVNPLDLLKGGLSFTGGAASGQAFGAPTSAYVTLASPFTVAGSGGNASGGVTGNSLLILALVVGAVFLARR